MNYVTALNFRSPFLYSAGIEFYCPVYYIVFYCSFVQILDNMHGIKDDREDSDGEEMEHESGESDKSSSSCDSSDAPSDSDDSSGIELLCNAV